MRSVFLDVMLRFTTPAEAWESEEVLLRFLGVVGMLNRFYLRRHPETPKLYSRAAGIKYCPPDQMQGSWIPKEKIPEFARMLRGEYGMDDDRAAIIIRLVSGAEIFQDIPLLYKRKKGDCDRLVSARLGELWVGGFIASPYLIPYKNETGGTTYHAVVLHPDNTTEDPSLILGMGGPARARDRAEEIRKNYERKDKLVAAATQLMVDGGDIQILGAMIDAAAFVPVGGFPRLPAGGFYQ
jgi:hypothetical protein